MDDLGNKKIMADNLVYYMAANRVSRADLCRDLGFKYTTVTGWVTGEKYPRIDSIEKMANYFGISKSDLVESKEKKPAPEYEDELDRRIMQGLRSLPESKKQMILDLIEFERGRK